MDEDEWGPEIEVYFQRPGWLDPNCDIWVQNKFGDWCDPKDNTKDNRDFAWEHIPKIRLKKTNPYYRLSLDAIDIINILDNYRR